MENRKYNNDKEQLLAIVKEMAASFTGEQSTRHWADDTLWFDIPPIALQGREKACRVFENAFRQLKSIEVEILSTDVHINGDMGIVCSVQRWKSVGPDGTVNAPAMVRQTNCFERRDGEWQLIHQHDSIPAGGDWSGEIDKL